MYKDTLKLPKKDMPLKLQKDLESRWISSVDQFRYLNQPHLSRKVVLHDGPPYANGPIHIGHAMNKILKDFVVKFGSLDSKSVSFKPGWDCHGLPIEKAVLQHKDAKELGTVEFRQKCREYASQQVEEQRRQFKLLGIAADWDNPYLTMNNSYETFIYEKMLELLRDGDLIEREKPVYWSYAEQTALAEAEIEYKSKKDTSLYLIFRSSGYNVLVWTTTPWTLPSNVAVAINPNEVYVVAKFADDGGVYQPVLVSRSSYKTLLEKGIVSGTTGHLTGTEIAKQEYLINPVNGRRSKIILDEFVDPASGTGAVHIAPGHGEADYQIGLKHNLPTIMAVGPDGRYTQQIDNFYQASDLSGVHVFSSNEIIISDLKNRGFNVFEEEIEHSYPFCSRSGKPILFRSTKQWFVDLNNVKNHMFDLDAIPFYPNDRDKLKKMIQERPEWCVSRQRKWGVPIALFRNVSTGKILLDEAVFQRIKATFEAESSDAWWTKPNEYFLGETYDSTKYEKITDVLDVWFDSGVSWHVVGQPAIYLEGTDQHRGWFQSSYVLGHPFTPFNQIITHGFVLDKAGKKMAKSEGNVISPLDMINKYGVEVLRYWIASTDWTHDMRISDEIMTRSQEAYQKLRNTLRFIVSNLDEEEPDFNGQLSPESQRILWRMRKVYEDSLKDNTEFRYSRSIQRINEFVVNQLSNLYFSSVKDTLYCGGPTERAEVQHVMICLLEALSRLVMPFFTYTIDEVLSYCPKWAAEKVGATEDGNVSVFNLKNRTLICQSQQEYTIIDHEEKVADKFNLVFNELKQLELVKDPLEVVIVGEFSFPTFYNWIGASDQQSKPLDEVNLLTEFRVGDKSYAVYRSSLNKCGRCWRRLAEDNICPRCKKVVESVDNV